MYGENRQLKTIQCAVCKRWTSLRIDPDDLARMLYGSALVQDCMPYLDSGERELLLTATCAECWALLCPDPVAFPLAYN